jgi:hypothetical protein
MAQMDAAIEQNTPMTMGQMAYRMQEQAKQIRRLTRTLEFREARIDELARMVHDLRTIIAKRQPGGPRATVEESPDYQPHIPKKRIPKAVIGRA